MEWYRKQGMCNKIVLPVGLMLVLALGVLAWQVQSRTSLAINDVAKRGLVASAAQYSNEVGSFFGTALSEAQSLADALEYSRSNGFVLPRETIISLLVGMEKGNPSFLAAGAAWEPNAYDRDDANSRNGKGSDPDGRFIPYVVDGELSLLEDLETSDYYKVPKQRARTTLANPYVYTVGGKDVLMTTASAAMTQHGKFNGIVLLDILLESIGELVGRIHIYESGWGAVITQDGVIVAHKNKQLVNTSIFDTPFIDNAANAKMAMRNGEPLEVIRDAGDGESIFYYSPMLLQNTGQTWYFMVAAPMSEVLAEANAISKITIGISLAVLVFALLLIVFIVRVTVKPLGYLAGTAHEIADGNLRLTIQDERFGGEIKELSTALKNMIASLLENIGRAEEMSKDAQAQTQKAQEAMRDAEAARIAAENAKREGMLTAANQLEGIVHIISSASDELSTQITQSERGSVAQASRVCETAVAMEEMNSTVLEVAKNAAAASHISSETRTSAESGTHIVQQAVTGIQNVQKVSLALKGDMAMLAGQAQSITQIMSVISDIADQTNLLALNAAIEAARAGEAGRGFAVVADEVRKLAEKTMASTGEVGNAIQSVQNSVNQSISRVDDAVSLIEHATEQANRSGEALQGIVGMVDNTADQVQAIAAASEEQSATSEEINRSISQINEIASQTSQAMGDAAKAVSELSMQAQKLTSLITEMKNA